MDDEALYEAAALELERDGPRKGLWAMAFAKAGGNDNAAKALYMELRVAQLKEDVARRTEEERRQRDRQAAAEAEIERQRGEEATRETEDAAPWLNFASKIRNLGMGEDEIRENLIGRGLKASVAERVARQVFHVEHVASPMTNDYEADVRNRLHKLDDVDLLDRITRGLLTPQARRIALEELRSRGRKVDGLSAAPPDPITGIGSKPDAKGFLGKLVNGDLGLAKTYWLYGVLVGFIVTIMSNVITSVRGLAVLMLAYTAYGIPWVLGTWRAANKYEGPKIWAVLAKIALIIAVIGLLIGLLALWGLLAKA